jgi:hypothetical protein
MSGPGRTGKNSTNPRLCLLLSLVVVVIISAGCSGKSSDPRALLDQTLTKATEVSQSNTTLVFTEELSMHLESASGNLEQLVKLAGAIQMPLKEDYIYVESWSGSLTTEEVPLAATLSYVTLDRGKTAYVKGSQLEKGLGAIGWVFYTPPADDSHYFDYLETVRAIIDNTEEVSLSGEEEINGIACWHLEVTPSLDAMIEEQLASNPAFREKYQDTEVGKNIREVREEIWVSRDTFYPVRIYTMMELENSESGEVVTLTMQADFSRYGEALESPIDAPAIYTKAN